MRQKRGNGAGRDQQPRQEPYSQASQHSSGRHRTLIAAHQREASDPRHPAAPHPRDAAAFDADGYSTPPADAQDWDAAGDEWDAGATAHMDQPPAHPPRCNTLAPRRPANSTVIYDRETGLLPINLPALGAPPTTASPTAPTALAPVPLARPPRRHTLQRVTQGVGRGVMRAAATGALVLHFRARNAGVTVIPGTDKVSVHIPALPGKRIRASRLARPAVLVATCVALVSVLVLAGVANHDGIIGPIAQGMWAGRSSVHALPTPIGGWWDAPIASDAPPAPSITDPAHYVKKYGFDAPALNGSISAAERQRLADMLPFALAATARWDARYGDSLEPQMLLYWTHAEGISARVNYSNCANEYPSLGYFKYIANCDTPSFWQLGYGNQFSVISILKTAFTDMRGDPNDPQAVQHVGQAVLDWDRKQGTVPACGGYSCTFPAITIDQLMAGVSLTHMTVNDWWASVLSRDPAINCYMLARALVWFSHDATRRWVGCYYAEPCWTYESNRLGDILASWDSLRKAARV